MEKDQHHYGARLEWLGNRGEGTARYRDYGREFAVHIAGKPTFAGSADPAFLGDPARHNPEDLLLIALTSCHMLAYLALCARRRIVVLDYVDAAEGTMALQADGSGRFTEVLLRPQVTVRAAADVDLARDLHEHAHRLCFIANSCNFPIRHAAQVVASPSTDG